MHVRLALALAIALALFHASAAAAAPTVAVDAASAEDLYFKILHPQYAGHRLDLAGHYVLDAAAGVRAVDRVLIEVPESALDTFAVSMIRHGYLHAGDRHLRGENVMTFDADGTAAGNAAGAPETLLDGTQLTAFTYDIVRSYDRTMS